MEGDGRDGLDGVGAVIVFIMLESNVINVVALRFAADHFVGLAHLQTGKYQRFSFATNANCFGSELEIF